ncbi:uncharacterized protein LACBIDRAFT_325808 [Laccaria bicolor S238N-H82]|uniref:Predicted protein n=1 Tax=Laccaria bicolor (strain S238N-H82 / ATCC MYA-4686) TaxID=486041 RepID=B0D6A1_LACBS|nr:uncharacterized protein LACBIDRAFT_325808 [Laccaria bicolor S238N-H82]EDR09910.1 predicted protein [Laccaria bicolor S238N-H82]|eukprot:XP_001879295.1 predicted protein [Laccaria bicolor S238N-H82]
MDRRPFVDVNKIPQVVEVSKEDEVDCRIGDLYKLCLPAVPKQAEELKAEPYKTPNAVVVPLQVYFAILSSFVSSPDVPLQLFWYLDHLQHLVDEYQWEGVLAYHTLFFNERVREMKNNCYSGWGAPRYVLMSCLKPEDPLSPSKTIPTLQLESRRLIRQDGCWGDYYHYPVTPITIVTRRTTGNPLAKDLKFQMHTKHSGIWESFAMERESSKHHGQLVALHDGKIMEPRKPNSTLYVEDLAKAFSYEGGEYPFLTLTTRREYEEATAWARKARLEAEKYQRRSARVSAFKSLFPHAFNIFAPSNSRVRKLYLEKTPKYLSASLSLVPPFLSPPK